MLNTSALMDSDITFKEQSCTAQYSSLNMDIGEIKISLSYLFSELTHHAIYMKLTLLIKLILSFHWDPCTKPESVN
jgi:hypothetical protein